MAGNNSGGNALTLFRADLDRMTSQFAMVMPPEVVDRFKRVFITTISANPDLLKCSPRSLIQCAMRAAQDGLDLDGREAACVPFKSEQGWIANYVPMVLGLRKKVRQTGLVSDWMVHVVFEGDEFEIAFGDRPYVMHKPSLKGGRKRPIIGAYSIAIFTDGTRSYEFMNVDEIEDIRSKSKSRHGPWSDPIFYPEMARKTVARLHAKQLPMSSDLSALFAREDDENGPGPLPPPTSRRPSTVSHALDEFGAGGGPMLSPPQHPVAAEDQAGGEPPPLHSDSFPGPDFEPEPEPSEAETPAAETPEQFAYRRGQEFKAAYPDANARKTLPGEYRDSAHTREALAWQAGFDGAPMPSFPQQ